MRTIKVTGRGTLSIAPDTMSLGISLAGTEKEYVRAMEKSSKETRALQEAIAGLGLAYIAFWTISKARRTRAKRAQMGV